MKKIAQHAGKAVLKKWYELENKANIFNDQIMKNVQVQILYK